MVATHRDYTPLKMLTVFPAIIFVLAPPNLTSATKLTVPLFPVSKVQGWSRQHAVADSERALLPEDRDFDDITMRINGVARARTSRLICPASPVWRMSIIPLSARRVPFTLALLLAPVAKMVTLPGAQASRIEQGKKLPVFGNINRNTTWFSALERDVPPVGAGRRAVVIAGSAEELAHAN